MFSLANVMPALQAKCQDHLLIQENDLRWQQPTYSISPPLSFSSSAADTPDALRSAISAWRTFRLAAAFSGEWRGIDVADYLAMLMVTPASVRR
jgi:hypothetical protein